jgi:TolA-binding protein
METPDFAKSHLGTAVLMLVASVGGSMVHDRLTTETRDTSSALRVEQLEKRLTEHLADAVSRRQFDEVEAQNAKRFEEIRQDLKDIAGQIRQRDAPK